MFKPAGVPATELQAVELGLDEVEALRLADVEGLYHDAAAQRMGVSRPTFGRLVQAARHKVAVALLEGRMLVFQGGPVAAGQPTIDPPVDERGYCGRRRRCGGWRRMDGDAGRGGGPHGRGRRGGGFGPPPEQKGGL